MKTFKTAESVCIGHPDKLCDLIADSVLDEYLYHDVGARVACEVMATKHIIILSGEITSTARVKIRYVARKALKKAGYNPNRFIIINLIHKQSKDISDGVSESFELRQGDNSVYSSVGAGDQGTVYGYSTDETAEHIPLPLLLSHRICKQLDECRENEVIRDIKSDGKAQVTVEYEDDVPKRVKAVVVSVQHSRKKDLDELKKEIIDEVLVPAMSIYAFDDFTEIHINPSGRFVKGGPMADTGLTGRKLMVDTYGGLALHGGGAFSGKDPTKVDRSGAYMARYLANNVVASRIAKECTVSISYAIGMADPVSIHVDTHGTSEVSDEIIASCIKKIFNMRPLAIIEKLQLKKGNYKELATYGHFGNGYPAWEVVKPNLQLHEEVAIRHENFLKEQKNGKPKHND